MSYIAGTMFLRRKCRHKDGKPHYYWELVESYRTERGPRQRVVSHLGDMDDPAMREELLHVAEGHVPIQESLFDAPMPEWVEVNVRKVRVERPRRFGDVWLALELIKKLGLGELFDRVMPDVHPKIPWARLAEVLIVARLCEPPSELHIAESFYRKSVLSDLLGIPEEDMYDNRLYRALDRLLEHKDVVQRHLKERLGELFAVTYDILLFEGNRHDSRTVDTIIEKMESLYGKSDRVWIMDRGMASEDNLELLADEHRRYIIGTPQEPAQEVWKTASGQGLEAGARGPRSQTLPFPRRRPGNVHPVPQCRPQGERAGDASRRAGCMTGSSNIWRRAWSASSEAAPPELTDAELRTMFEKFGNVLAASIGGEKTDRSEGYGFGDMPVKSEARTAGGIA